MFNKKLMAAAVAVSLASFAGSAFATDEINKIDITFNGHVTAPTCNITQTEKTVNLSDINLAELSDLATGKATAQGKKNFKINLNCPEKISQNNVKLAITGAADSTIPTVLANSDTSEDSAEGVGFEIFSLSGGDQNVPLPVDGSAVPSAAYIDRLNAGDDNLEFAVEYAKVDSNVTAGNLTSKATFEFIYK